MYLYPEYSLLMNTLCYHVLQFHTWSNRSCVALDGIKELLGELHQLLRVQKFPIMTEITCSLNIST